MWAKFDPFWTPPPPPPYVSQLGDPHTPPEVHLKINEQPLTYNIL